MKIQRHAEQCSDSKVLLKVILCLAVAANALHGYRVKSDLAIGRTQQQNIVIMLLKY